LVFKKSSSYSNLNLDFTLYKAAASKKNKLGDFSVLVLMVRPWLKYNFIVLLMAKIASKSFFF
jgi:hypothetical protein